MTDELAARRRLRTGEPDPETGDLGAVREDLHTIHGMVTEVRAEAAVAPDATRSLRDRLDDLDEAVGRAINTAEEVT